MRRLRYNAAAGADHRDLSACAASLDSGEPRWDDAAQGGAADGAPWESPESPAVRGGRGWAWAGGGVWAAAGAGAADDGKGPSPRLFEWHQSDGGGAKSGPLPAGARRTGLRG